MILQYSCKRPIPENPGESRGPIIPDLSFLASRSSIGIRVYHLFFEVLKLSGTWTTAQDSNFIHGTHGCIAVLGRM
jgi:hypothetical protein